jgi:hypothetical protein
VRLNRGALAAAVLAALAVGYFVFERAQTLPAYPIAAGSDPKQALAVRPPAIIVGIVGIVSDIAGDRWDGPIAWDSWTATQASGRGRFWWVEGASCPATNVQAATRACAADHGGYPVTISLSTPRDLHGQLVFTRATFIFTKEVPQGWSQRSSSQVLFAYGGYLPSYLGPQP